MKGHKTMTREEKAIRAATPGRFLQVEFLDEYGISQAELARIRRLSFDRLICEFFSMRQMP